MRERVAVWSFWAGGALAAVGSAWIAAAAPRLSIPAIAAAATGWLLALACADRVRARWPLLLVVALASRCGPWIAGPRLSDDIHRYVWEGAIVADGGSPYAVAPADPRLAHARAERPELHLRVAHPDVAAIYPPLAQAVHALAWMAAPGDGDRRARAAETIVRGAYLAADIAVIALLVALLRRRGLPEARCVAWAWAPTCALEFAGSGHLDSSSIALLLAAWLVVERGSSRWREASGAALLAAAILIRYLPLAALPAWWLRRRRRVTSVAVLAGGMLLGWAPFLAAGGILGGLETYGERWEGFNLAYRPIASAVRALAPSDTDPRALAHVARVVCAILWLAISAAGLWIGQRRDDELHATRVSIGAFLALTPVLHPWYLAWMAPFLALRRDVEWAWLLAAAPLAYAPLEAWRGGGGWNEAPWTWPLLALPFFALLAARLARGARAHRWRGVARPAKVPR